MGIDAYYKKSTDLLDEGQFGTALIFTPFNYSQGRVMGVELTANYHTDHFSAYANLAYSHAQGKDIDSAQFNFSAAELAFSPMLAEPLAYAPGYPSTAEDGPPAVNSMS